MLRTLICDDDEHYRALVRVVLEGQHDIVSEAKNAADCVARVVEHRPDVVLLDLKLPGMSGLEIMPSIREHVPQAKVVALTAMSPVEYEPAFIELGGFAYIEKPHDIMALGGLLRLALEGTAGHALRRVEDLLARWRAGDRDLALAMMSEDVAFTPYFGDGRTLHGRDALVAYIDGSDGLGTGEVIQLLAVDETVVALTVATISPSHPGAKTTRLPMALVFRVSEDGITSIGTFDDWDAAKRAAGLVPPMEPDAQRTYQHITWIRVVMRVRRWFRRHAPVGRHEADRQPVRAAV